MRPSITLLAPQHDRSRFNCGIESLDRYLKQQATQDTRRGFATPYVLTEQEQSAVLGYYTLSMSSVPLGEFSAEFTKKIPRYPIVPAVLLGRLAVDRSLHGQGWGKYLLFDALHRCLEFEPAWHVVIVEAIDSSAKAFYEHYGFQSFTDSASRLFITRKTVEQVFLSH